MIEAKAFWSALGQRPIGVSIVTAKGAEGFAGFLALSAAHVCASPPTMLVSIDDGTSALAAILHGGHFAVNYLNADQAPLAQVFSGKTELRASDRFADGDWEILASGAPVLRNAIAVIDCSIVDMLRHESTTIALGRVVQLRTGGGSALIYSRGEYRSL